MFKNYITATIVPIVALLLLALSNTTQIVAQETTSITRFAPENVVVCLAMTGDVRLDPAGSGLERWLAQPEMRESFQILTEFIDDRLKDESPELIGLPALIPQVVIGRPWILIIEEPNLEKPQLHFALSLGTHEEVVKQKLELLVDSSDGTVETFSIAGTDFRQIEQNNGTKLEFGIHQNHLLVGLNASVKNLVDRFNAGEPKWFDEIRKELPLVRNVGYLRIDTQRLLEHSIKEKDAFLTTFKFEEINQIVGTVGFDGEETVSRLAFHCPEKLRGFWKIFDAAPIQKADLKGVSDSVHFLSSLQMNPEVLWNLLLDSEDSRQQVEKFQERLLKEYEINFEKEIVQNFAGPIYFYQQITLLNPTANLLMGVRVKDPTQFAKTLESIVAATDQIDLNFGIDVQETKNGPLYTIVPYDPQLQMFIPGACFQIVDDELLFGLDPKAITAHMRKASREGGKLTDDPRMARVFDTQIQGQLGRPVAVAYLDLKVVIETVYSVLPMIFSQFDQMGAGSGLDMDMLPPLENIVDGLLPNIVAMYRTKNGFQMIDRSTLPGVSLNSSVAIAMILPAVQQVRAAARRATSMNNLRQLAIACHNYESALQAFPPAYRTDKGGKKLLSWRVEILPFLEQGELYEKFHHDERWDSPHNKALIEEMPDVFCHPQLTNLEKGKTVYLGVAGQQSIFVPSASRKGTKISQVTDGLTNTLLLVEANEGRAVYWTQPDDFNVDEIEDLNAALRGNWGIEGFLAVKGDGSVETLVLDDAVLRKMATINGEEVLSSEDDDE